MKGHEILLQHKVLERELKKGNEETWGDREVRGMEGKKIE
jgi:hypothetical protein